MSRLDSFIRRLEAQRACLDHAAGLVADLPGPVLELGLGNGRTYDHLRERLPDREIFVFERKPDAHPLCMPDAEHLILGDLEDTLPAAPARLPGPAALVHSDIGTGDALRNRSVAARIALLLPALLRPGAVIVSDQPLPAAGLREAGLPAEVAGGRYFLYYRI
ncbi:MAG TPA: class I SAM-dependent methyltransferase [Geminicoccaceae bacterium]|nr:class I SAM-dependent methyltransferase [Geminicoccus sp.]HMU52783.1 class I SAM-dependent methyltransferase [Geminicoccaceae bacterium]